MVRWAAVLPSAFVASHTSAATRLFSFLNAMVPVPRTIPYFSVRETGTGATLATHNTMLMPVLNDERSVATVRPFRGWGHQGYTAGDQHLSIKAIGIPVVLMNNRHKKTGVETPVDC